MFEERSTQTKKKEREKKEEEDLMVREEKKDQDASRDTSNIIEDAFKPIQCTFPFIWKIHSRSLLEQIDEDHPSERKSTEYNLNEKKEKLLPIGQGITEKTQNRVIGLPRTKPESNSGEILIESRKSQYFEEMQVFARKRGIPISSTLIYSISKDQEGSRFIQKKLDSSSQEEIDITFLEVKKWISDLIVDLFGNYVIQKFLEIGSQEQQQEIFLSMEPMIIPLALHMYGCRVVQKALECKEINRKIVERIQGHVIDLVCDQNGNHVIQKCVECVDADFIIKEFEQDAVGLSKHRYGCRVIQRIFENSTKCTAAVERIINNSRSLVEDQYGNYVIQHILEKGTEEHKRRIIENFIEKLPEYSTHKFASNVMEKCVLCGTQDARKKMLSQLMQQKPGKENMLITISSDKFGNYVIQRMLDVLTGKDKDLLVSSLRAHLTELKKSSYAKCIVSKIA
ncbi:pumilio RNA-binding family [Nematocida sp. LUAm3]|nr:pumilio RNA-binding family [Nematocida sp. LUAm3]KAI5175224.1 pumilio RNA-binding family [Nematocida sp. LUAm2]KAI5178104.1 pumilio RNA-binding family [Nematocida sp. LUAm1]